VSPIQLTPQSVEASRGAFEKPVRTFGLLEVLVNSAGTAKSKTFEEATQGRWTA